MNSPWRLIAWIVFLGVVQFAIATPQGTNAVMSPPAITQRFDPPLLQFCEGYNFGEVITRLPVNQVAMLHYTITNPNAGQLTGIGMTDQWLTPLVVGGGGLSTSCGGGAVTAAAGTSQVTVSGATLAAGASCTFTVPMLAPTDFSLYDWNWGVPGYVCRRSTGTIGSDQSGITAFGGLVPCSSIRLTPPVIVFARPRIPVESSVELRYTATPIGCGERALDVRPWLTHSLLSGLQFEIPSSHLFACTPCRATGCRIYAGDCIDCSIVTVTQTALSAPSVCGFSVTVQGKAVGRHVTTTGDALYGGWGLGHPLTWSAGSATATLHVYGERRTNGIGDFNADGMADVLWRDTSDGDVGMWLLDGSTLADGALAGTVPLTSSVVGIGDFDGDGSSDILWRDAAGGTGIWLMDRFAIKAGGFSGTAPPEMTVAGVADFNGDGRSDVLWLDSSGGVGVWLMNGASVQGGSLLGYAPGLTVEGTGDLDGDGTSDILFRDTMGAMGYWGIHNAAVATGGMIVPALAPDFVTAGIGDFDGDGPAEVLLRDLATGDVFVLRQDSSLVFAGTAGDTLSIRGTGDYDGDGRADILWTDAAGNVAVWIMNGSNIVGGGYVGFATPNHVIQ